MIVAKLKGARERKRVITGKKVEGRKSHAELRPDLVALVRHCAGTGLKVASDRCGRFRPSLQREDI